MRGKNSDMISASQVAELGVCERKVYLRGKYGDRKVSKEREYARKRGNEIHARANEAYYKKTRDRRCFIASCVYGVNDKRTDFLREFRDKTLVKNKAGEILTRVYYMVSPAIVEVINVIPVLKKPVKWMLDIVLKKVGFNDAD